MKDELTQKICTLIALALLLSAIGPGVSFSSSAAAKIDGGSSSTQEFSGPTYSAILTINGINTKSVYSASVSDKKIAVCTAVGFSKSSKTCTFKFRIKKFKPFKVTIKEKTGSKTKKIGVQKITPKKMKNLYYTDKQYKKAVSYLNKGIVTTVFSGTSLEVTGIKSLKSTSKKTTMVLKLAHKVTADEYKASQLSNYKADKGYFPVELWANSSADKSVYGNSFYFAGTIKKGQKTITVTSGSILPKGKAYYLTKVDKKGKMVVYSKKCK